MTRKPARKMPRKPPHRAPRRAEPTDIEKANAAGMQYAEDQLEGDYFTDWVRDQLLEASRMPEDKVLPLKTKSDAMMIAKKMLRQLEWDTKRDLSAHDIERLIYADGTNPDAVDAFLEGFSATLELARDWLADELLEIKSEMGGRGRGRLSEERSNIPSQNPLSGPRKEERDLAIERAVKLARSTGEDHAVTMDRRGDYRVVVTHQAPAKDTIAFVNHRGHITHKRHGVEERHPSGVREHDTVDDPFYVIQGLYSNGYLAGSSFGYDDEATAIREAEKLARSSYFEGDYVRIITRDGELVWSSNPERPLGRRNVDRHAHEEVDKWHAANGRKTSKTPRRAPSATGKSSVP